MCFSDYLMPSSFTKEGAGCPVDIRLARTEAERRRCPMNTLEVLTLLLVVFAALSYIDDHNKKK